MSGNKNIRNSIAEFFRYIRNELPGKERNLFEREIQKDPFAEDALDGFAMISEHDATEDISELNERLGKRTVRKNSSVIYRIAGIIALLLSVSVLVVTILKKPENQLAINTPEPESIEIIKNQPIIVPDSKDNSVSEQAKAEKKSENKQSEAKGFTRSLDSIVKDDKISDEISAPESKAYVSREEISKRLVVAAPVTASARKQASNNYTITGKVLSADDNMPIPGANIRIKGTSNGAITNQDGNFSLRLPDSSNKTLVASFIGMETQEIRTSPDSQLQIKLNSSSESLSEVVVVGYGSKKSDQDEEETSEYIHPRPVTGKSEFDDYVKNNLHRPDNSAGSKKEVVVLSFIVRTSGQIDSIRIIKSPGKAYSDEAIRVVRSGPAWNPAMDNGNPIEEDVRLRIVFR
jgi:hypothetical protein